MLRYRMLDDRSLNLRLQFLNLGLQLLHIHGIDAHGFLLSFTLSEHTVKNLIRQYVSQISSLQQSNEPYRMSTNFLLGQPALLIASTARYIRRDKSIRLFQVRNENSEQVQRPGRCLSSSYPCSNSQSLCRLSAQYVILLGFSQYELWRLDSRWGMGTLSRCDDLIGGLMYLRQKCTEEAFRR